MTLHLPKLLPIFTVTLIALFLLVATNVCGQNPRSRSLDGKQILSSLPERAQSSSAASSSTSSATAKLHASREAALGPIVTFYTDGLTTTTFESWLCGNLSAGTVSQLNILRNFPSSTRFLLPDCFYELSGEMFFFTATAVILQGNATHPDPLVRIGKALHQNYPIILSLSLCILVNPNSDYLVDWSGTFDALPLVDTIQFTSMNLASANTLPATMPLTLPATMHIFTVTNCGLTGSIPASLYDLFNPSFNSLYLDLSSNSLSGAIPATLLSNVPFSNIRYFTLLLYSNLLEGTIPTTLFSTSPSAMTDFMVDFSSNRLSGEASNLFASLTIDCSLNLRQLNLANTAIRFCAGNRTSWTSTPLTTCKLEATEAYYCDFYYPSQCDLSKPTVPTGPGGCSASARPSPDWICVDSTWVYYGSFNGTTLTIPSGNSESVVVGNVTSSTIVIGGSGSSLTLQAGCATNLTTVTIELSPSEIGKLTTGTSTVILSSYGGSGCTNLSTVNVEAKIKGHSCRKVTVKKQSDENSLSAIFSVDSGGCRTWWIILVSVVAAVVFIAVVVFILLAIFVPAVRRCIRPFSKRQRPPGAV